MHVKTSSSYQGNLLIGVFIVGTLSGIFWIGFNITQNNHYRLVTLLGGSALSLATAASLIVCVKKLNKDKEARESAKEASESAIKENQARLEKDRLFIFDLIAQCSEFYESRDERWVMVPPKTSLEEGGKPRLAIGSASYTSAGHFKIHISIDPKDMQKTIPIIITTLYQPGAPKVGLKFQTEGLLSKDHQIGKEFALIFSSDVEENEHRTHAVAKILSTLQELFVENEIACESGMVLTAKNHRKIAAGKQALEKQNLGAKKFDRQIPGSQYFYYRNDSCIPIADSEVWAKTMSKERRRAQNIVLFFEMDEILAQNPENIHNPLGEPDPYSDIDLNKKRAE